MRSHTINRKPADCLITVFPHCYYFILVSVWSKALSCRHRHAVIHRLAFKLRCPAFDSCSCLTEGLVTAAWIPLWLSHGCVFAFYNTQQLSECEAQLRNPNFFMKALHVQKHQNPVIHTELSLVTRYASVCVSQMTTFIFSCRSGNREESERSYRWV